MTKTKEQLEEEKKKRLEEAEMKRQAMMQAQKEKQQAAGLVKESLLIISHWENCINFWSKFND